MAELNDEAVELQIDTEAAPGQAPVVRLAGELDSSNADRVAAAMVQVLAERPGRVVFDLSGLQFMDSAGISVLVRTAAEVETVEIRDPSPIVRRVLEVTGLTGVLQVEP
jgi:anti-anti-sigma factor